MPYLPNLIAMTAISTKFLLSALGTVKRICKSFYPPAIPDKKAFRQYFLFIKTTPNNVFLLKIALQDLESIQNEWSRFKNGHSKPSTRVNSFTSLMPKSILRFSSHLTDNELLHALQMPYYMKNNAWLILGGCTLIVCLASITDNVLRWREIRS